MIAIFCTGLQLSIYFQSTCYNDIKRYAYYLEFGIICIIFRDLKTANIFLTNDSVVKLGDFGISKQLEGSKANTVLGTPYYISPEMVCFICCRPNLKLKDI